VRRAPGQPRARWRRWRRRPTRSAAAWKACCAARTSLRSWRAACDARAPRAACDARARRAACEARTHHWPGPVLGARRMTKCSAGSARLAYACGMRGRGPRSLRRLACRGRGLATQLLRSRCDDFTISCMETKSLGSKYAHGFGCGGPCFTSACTLECVRRGCRERRGTVVLTQAALALDRAATGGVHPRFKMCPKN